MLCADEQLLAAFAPAVPVNRGGEYPLPLTGAVSIEVAQLVSAAPKLAPARVFQAEISPFERPGSEEAAATRAIVAAQEQARYQQASLAFASLDAENVTAKMQEFCDRVKTVRVYRIQTVPAS